MSPLFDFAGIVLAGARPASGTLGYEEYQSGQEEVESFSSLVHEMRRERYKGTVLVCNKETEWGWPGQHGQQCIIPSTRPSGYSSDIRFSFYGTIESMPRGASAAVSTVEETSAKKSRDKGSTRNANAICLMTVNQRQTDGSERQFKAVKRRGGLGRPVTRHQRSLSFDRGHACRSDVLLEPRQCTMHHLWGGSGRGCTSGARCLGGKGVIWPCSVPRWSAAHLRHLIGMISCTTMRGKVLGGASE